MKYDDKITEVAMEIVVTAGEAREQANQALDAVSQFDFDKAREYLAEAKAYITKAHNAQTEIIQTQIAGEAEYEPSLLFNHAQDTLMTVMTEINLTEKLITLFEAFNEKMESSILMEKVC